MKISRLLIASAIACLAVSPALAADPIAEIIQGADNWSGVYVAGIVGADWSKAGLEHQNVNNFGGPGGTYEHSGTGLIGGVVAGYNWEFDNGLVLGGELGFRNGAKIGDGGEYAIYSNFTHSRLDYLGTAKARLGYDVNGWMPYVTGGYALGRVSTSQVYAPSGLTPTTWSDAQSASGYVIGAGIDVKLTERVFVGFEYNHVDLGRVSFAGADSSGKETEINSKLKSDSVFVRLGMKF